MVLLCIVYFMVEYGGVYVTTPNPFRPTFGSVPHTLAGRGVADGVYPQARGPAAGRCTSPRIRAVVVAAATQNQPEPALHTHRLRRAGGEVGRQGC